MFKSPTQPHCRYCGKKIRKWTEHRWLDGGVYRSKADVQRATNQKVASLRYGIVSDCTSYWAKQREQGAKLGEKIVTGYSTWDGESYEDEFFCNGDHAKRFAYRMARKLMR